MSLYTLNPIKEGFTVVVGYDAPVDSYFLQVRRTNEQGSSLIQWRGNGILDQAGQGIVNIPEIILTDAAKYAMVPEDLLPALLADRDLEPEQVSSEEVVYAGLPNKEVWRCRASVDTPAGTRLKMSPASAYTFSQRVSMAILRDFVGDEDRARRIVWEVSANVISKIVGKRAWLLTERDLNAVVLETETSLGLRWLKEHKCYAGEGKRVPAELQLRRAARKRNTSQPAEMRILATV
jgi:hypothetical protein